MLSLCPAAWRRLLNRPTPSMACVDSLQNFGPRGFIHSPRRSGADRDRRCHLRRSRGPPCANPPPHFSLARTNRHGSSRQPCIRRVSAPQFRLAHPEPGPALIPRSGRAPRRASRKHPRGEVSPPDHGEVSPFPRRQGYAVPSHGRAMPYPGGEAAPHPDGRTCRPPRRGQRRTSAGCTFFHMGRT